ncbi:Endoglucanase A [Streptomyces sp. RB5]|uniref:Glucanase n=1 Tax=Streptomyces smaragdinus TaxID=2585196 RepID=A0A7K0CMW2_9ACTN|nr:glycoside hydrolase family 6 protein [Streptomyces smaragdinus]MQY14603.1 Endoglucanase A [Streptomyces smaragdinus]
MGTPDRRRMPGPLRLLAAVVAAIAALVGAAVPAADDSPFWVDPESDAARQAEQWASEGRADDARLVRRIAGHPQAAWVAGNNPRPDVARVMAGAGKAGKTAVLVAYNIPHRDCGQHSAGGAPDGGRYLDWVGEFAEEIGDGEAIVVLEPDAVPHMVDGCTPRDVAGERTTLLSKAVARLKEQPRTKVYLDAGNSGWIRDPWQLAERLRESGIARSDGFALNTANFQTSADLKAYGGKISGFLENKHFIIDTSRNGNGPLVGEWCNPPGRALGDPPTTKTDDPLVDAYLWIKNPGKSDGSCGGGPQAGTWWPEYALGLARAAEEKESRTAPGRR